MPKTIHVAVLEKYKTSSGPKLMETKDKASFEGSQLTGPDASFTASHTSLLSDLIASLDRHMEDVQPGVNHATRIIHLAFRPERDFFD